MKFRLLFILITGLVSVGCTTEETSTGESFYKPSGVISQQRAEEISDAWTTKNSTLLRKDTNAKTEAEMRSFWWSLEDLRNYLNYAEHEAETKGYSMNGVRLYLAAYPEKNYQNTLFFAPTGYTVNSEASFFNTSFLLDDADEDIPVDPLNEAGGGENGYPPK